MLGASDEADDLVQDSFVRALSRLNGLDNPQAFAAWLTSFAVHGAQKRLRRRRLLIRLGLRVAEPLDPDLTISPVAPAEVVSELRAVYAVVARLSAEERIALLLRRVEGLDLAEIAQTMQISLATVKRRLVSAEKHLQILVNHSER
jgi:RNA polymerase sigma-70 factor (ECF subfamily)